MIDKNQTINTIRRIVEDGFCVGCGTCSALCPTQAITIVKDSGKSIYIPEFDPDKCNNCNICVKSCPGLSVDYHKLNSIIFGKQPDEILIGNYINCYTGHATDNLIRYNSASGGLVTALLIFALEKGVIDGALVTKMSEENPLEPFVFVARNKEEIISASRSKYCPVPVNIGLKTILNDEGLFAAVGLPCHINGIRKAELINNELKEKILLRLGIFCGLGYDFLATEFLLEQMKIRKEDVRKIDYRGDGWPGSITIKLKNNSMISSPYPEYTLHGFGNFISKHCLLCNEEICELADISFGDAWGLEETAGDKIGSSLVISRTTVGEKILRDAEATGKIQLHRVDSQKILQSQGSMLTKKKKYSAENMMVGKTPPPVNQMKLDHPQSCTEISTLQSSLQEKDAQIKSLTLRLEEKNQVISNLQSELNMIKSSTTWRAARKLHPIINRVLPPGTRRRHFVRQTLKAVVRPILNLFGSSDNSTQTQAETATKTLLSSAGLGTQLHNVMSFSAESLWTFNGNQYATYIDSAGKVMVAKRALPGGAWTTHDTGKTVDIMDLHKSSNLGIDPKGRIHIIFGCHDSNIDTAVHYIISTNPEDITVWTDKVAGMTGANEDQLTYPTFFTDGTSLFCIYRNHASGDGELYLNKYNHEAGTWSAIAAPLINPVADSKNPYLDAVVVDGVGTFHISWCWRILNTDGTWNNQNVCYAKSSDGGVTWQKSSGVAYVLPITYAASEVVDTIGATGGLLNQNDVEVDSSDYPHIAYYKVDTNGYMNYFHTWFNGSIWTTNQVTFFTDVKVSQFIYAGTLSPLPLGRPAIVCSGINVIILFCYPFVGGKLYGLKAALPYTSWKLHQIGSDLWRQMEVNIDRTYWASNARLDIMASSPDKISTSVPVYLLSTTPSSWH